VQRLKPIYLDYNATTPLTPQVIDAMRPFMEEHFGNPSSTHPYGRITQAAVEDARGNLASLIHAAPDEIIFTGGGTESNNMAIRGTARANYEKGNHIITTAIEHPAVSEVCHYLAGQGFQVTTLPVDSKGQVSPDDLETALRPETVLVSVMHANNEVGTIQPIKRLVSLTHQAGALFHTDAAQSVGKLPVDVDDLGVDLLSIAGHKLYAPKGIGALYVRQGIRMEKIIFGAKQENNRRPGTENVLEIVGLGAAAQQAACDLKANTAQFKAMRDRLHMGLVAELPKGMLRLNGHPDKRLPNTLNLSFINIEANILLDKIQDSVAASAGAACHAEDVKISSVLIAMGLPVEWAKGTVRFSVGRMTTPEEIDQAVSIVARAVQLLSLTNNLKGTNCNE
jgi:cysteine desulfurase